MQSRQDDTITDRDCVLTIYFWQRTREEKAKGIHHTQKREMFAGASDFLLVVFATGLRTHDRHDL